MSEFTNRVRYLENVLHVVKGILEDSSIEDPQRWVAIHAAVSHALEKGGIDELRERARWYLRDFINYPLNTRTGDSDFLRKLSFGPDPQWRVEPPPLSGTEPVYTVIHVPSGAEFKFNFFEISGDAST